MDQEGELSQVKIRMKESFEQYGGGCEPLEFEVDFAGLSGTDMDATVNWKVDDFDNKRTFFTDSNGLGIVKRVQ